MAASATWRASTAPIAGSRRRDPPSSWPAVARGVGRRALHLVSRRPGLQQRPTRRDDPGQGLGGPGRSRPGPGPRQPGDPIATADAGILDRCGPWINLARLLVEAVARGVRRRSGRTMKTRDRPSKPNGSLTRETFWTKADETSSRRNVIVEVGRPVEEAVCPSPDPSLSPKCRSAEASWFPGGRRLRAGTSLPLEEARGLRQRPAEVVPGRPAAPGGRGPPRRGSTGPHRRRRWRRSRRRAGRWPASRSAPASRRTPRPFPASRAVVQADEDQALPRKCSAASRTSGSWATQGPHSIPQKSTSTTLPARLGTGILPPRSSHSSGSIAGAGWPTLIGGSNGLNRRGRHRHRPRRQ